MQSYKPNKKTSTLTAMADVLYHLYPTQPFCKKEILKSVSMFGTYHDGLVRQGIKCRLE